MAVSVTFSITPNEAVRLGLPYYDMYIVGWGGGAFVHASLQGLVYPLAAGDIRLPAPRGIAIHPQSDVDRVIIQTSVGSGVGDAKVESEGGLSLNTFSLSVEAPLILAPPTIMPLPAAGQQPTTPTVTLRADPGAVYHTTYAKSGTSTLTAFSDAVLPAPLNELTAFMQPVLALRFYLQTPPTAGLVRTRLRQPVHRAPGSAAVAPLTQPVNVRVAVQSGEQLFAIIPVYGRCNLMASFRAVTCVPTIRVAVVDFSFRAPAAVPAAVSGRVQMERTLATSTALTSNVPVQLPITPGADWLLFYFTPGADDDGVLMWTLNECCAGGTRTLPGS